MRLYIDVHSKKAYPSNALSNFAEHPFLLDGVKIRCVEGLLQSLKVPPAMQAEVCQMDARSAKLLGSRYDWRENGAVFHWNGRYFSRYSREYHAFLNRVYDSLVDQSEEYAEALRDSGYAVLWHSIGKLKRKDTCLTTLEFVALLYRARKRARQHACR